MGIGEPHYVKTQFGGTERGLGRIFKFIFLAGAAGTLLAILAAGVFFWYFSRGLPQIIEVEDYRPVVPSRIFASEGKADEPVGEFIATEKRYVVPYDKIPEIVVRAFISAEDDRFFEHPGVNIMSIIRAGIANFRAGHVVQGGSTITQQVAKSLLLTSERTFDRKIKELILSTRIERNLSKHQILYLYLNQIYLGSRAYGVQAAAQTYFRKDVSQLNIAEAAILAGMPQAPGKYSPLISPKKAKERQLYVLRRLYENKYISQSQLAEATSQPVKVYGDEDLNLKYAPYFIEQIRRELAARYGDRVLYEDGLQIHIHPPRDLLVSARQSLREGLLALDKREGFRGPVKRLKSTDEMETFLKESRLELIRQKLGYQLLLPDGRLDGVEPMHYAGLSSDADLLDVGGRYRALVTALDSKKKSARVMIGAARAEMPAEGVRWARPVRDEKNPNAFRPEPTSAGKILNRGDVVWVKVVAKAPELLVSLEQEPEVQGALLSLETQTGYVLAMEGGYSFEGSKFNRTTQAQRQPGSVFKPILYAAGVEKGFTPASIIVDSPIVYETNDGFGKWKPGNFEERFYGDTTFRQALIKSRNIPTIKIAQAVGVRNLIEYAKRIGMNGQFPPDLSIALGSGSVTLMDITLAYGLFPRLGRKLKPILISKVLDRDGKILMEATPQTLPAVIKIPPITAPALPSGAAADPSNPAQSSFVLPQYPPGDDPDQVMDPRVAYVMGHLMKEVVSYGTGHEAKNLGRIAAGKTGTTQDYNDAWFVGFTPQVVTGAWVGYDNQISLGSGETGARAALPIWLNYMKEAVKPYPEADFMVPPGVVFASINAATGKLLPPNSSSAIKEAFIEGTEPRADGSGPSTPGAPNGTGPRSGSGQPENSGDFFKEDIE